VSHGSVSAALAHLFFSRFTGGLNRQAEHHLFPTLPRHNLGKAQNLIRAFCSKHGMYY
jgi:fatty acid desaturase